MNGSYVITPPIVPAPNHQKFIDDPHERSLLI